MRKYTVEPVFGHIKQARNFRQLLLRGIDKAKREWAMICTAHNRFGNPTTVNHSVTGTGS